LGGWVAIAFSQANARDAFNRLDAKFLALSTHALGSAAASALAALRILPQTRNVADVARLCAKAS
jgi:hypothetical protein